MRFAAAAYTAIFIVTVETVLELGDVLSVVAPTMSDAFVADEGSPWPVLGVLSKRRYAERDGPSCGLTCQSPARLHIRDLRSLLAGFRLAKQTAVQTAVRLIPPEILLALMAGIAIKLSAQPLMSTPRAFKLISIRPGQLLVL